MYCHKCGKELLDDAQYCRYCGTNVEFSDKVQEHNVNDLSKEEKRFSKKKTTLTKIPKSIIKFILYSVLFHILTGIYCYFTLPSNTSFLEFVTDPRGLFRLFMESIGGAILPLLFLLPFMLAIKRFGIVKKLYLLEIFFISMFVYLITFYNQITFIYYVHRVFLILGLILLPLAYLKEK